MVKYKVAIIGTGRIGYLFEKDKKREQPASHSSAFSKNKRTSLIAACDINKERLTLFKKDYPHVNCYENYILMMQKENPDIVVIAVPENLHSKIALDVFKYKPRLVVLEKPVATSLDDAYLIKKQADYHKIKVLINHERRYSKDYQLVKNLIQEETIGRISLIIASLWSNIRVFSKKNINDASCLLLHDATHLVDTICYIFDKKLRNPVIDRIIKRKNEIYELNLHYFLDKSTLVFMDLSGSKNYFGFEIELRGEKGRIIIGNGYFKLYLTKPSRFYTNFFSLEREKKIKRIKKTCYFSNMVIDCVNYLDKKVNNVISSLEDGIQDLEILFDIIKKIENI